MGWAEVELSSRIRVWHRSCILFKSPACPAQPPLRHPRAYTYATCSASSLLSSGFLWSGELQSEKKNPKLWKGFEKASTQAHSSGASLSAALFPNQGLALLQLLVYTARAPREEYRLRTAIFCLWIWFLFILPQRTFAVISKNLWSTGKIPKQQNIKKTFSRLRYHSQEDMILPLLTILTTAVGPFLKTIHCDMQSIVRKSLVE